DEGEASERQSEPQPTPSPPHLSTDQHETLPDLSPRPSPTIPIPASILEGSGGNHGGQSSSDRSLSGNEDDLTLQSIKQLKKKARPVINHHKVWIKSLSMKKRLTRNKKTESVSKQRRKTFKYVPTVHKDPAFDDLDDAMDYIKTEDAYDEGTVENQE
ncbi:hypothetical protein Tco_1159614, partial [Tanacetum coccineum]